jgi:hypothetical protein
VAETPSQLSSAQHALDKFVSGNLDLVELETIARRFNIFESLGIVNNELKHSNFLRFLLDPGESHGLSELFLKRFLQAAILDQFSVAQLTQSDIDVLDLSQASAVVERDAIDILISDPKNNLYVIIENKVGSLQHSDQLARYHKLVSERYPTDTILGIFLTRDGELPEYDQYVTLSYSSVRNLVDEVLKRQDARLEPDVKFALTQYAEVLGRHFMADEKVKSLCAKIYKQHKQAIDLIIDNLPDQRALITQHLTELIHEQKFILDKCTATYIRFIPPTIDNSYFKGSSWTPSGRMLLFEFVVSRDSVVLILQMGLGDALKRKRIHEFATSAIPPFQVEKSLYDKWQSLYRKVIVDEFDSGTDERDIRKAIDLKWQEFLDHDLRSIESLFRKHLWSDS